VRLRTASHEDGIPHVSAPAPILTRFGTPPLRPSGVQGSRGRGAATCAALRGVRILHCTIDVLEQGIGGTLPIRRPAMARTNPGLGPAQEHVIRCCGTIGLPHIPVTLTPAAGGFLVLTCVALRIRRFYST
jgi:hypothetical protein